MDLVEFLAVSLHLMLVMFFWNKRLRYRSSLFVAHSVTFEQHDVVLSSSAEIGNILQASVVVMMSELFFFLVSLIPLCG